MGEASKTERIDAVLLDMDGTLLTSIAAAERVWGRWAARHGLDVKSFLPTIHGRQAVETVRLLNLPGVDPETEAAAITRAEIEDVAGVEAIAGVADFLAGLPVDRWAVVTSAPRALAERRLGAAGLPCPSVLIAAEDVARSKPEPDGFELAAQRLGTTADRCLVLEDSSAGIAAGEAAGARVVVVTATHEHAVETAWPTIRDYRDLVLERDGEGTVHIRFGDGRGYRLDHSWTSSSKA